MSDIKPGDEVRVFNSFRKTPDGGHVATVTKVGRTYATATYTRYRTAYPAGPVKETVEFDMATGQEKGTGTSRVKTLAQVEMAAREASAVASLLACKIRLDSGHGLTLEQIEALAELVKTWEA